MKGHKKANLVEGGDTLIGTAAADVFVIREGDGDKIIEGFEAGKDRILFDFNSYSDIVGPLGYRYDGQEFSDFTGQTHFSIHAVDLNSDGLTDTRIDVNDDSITLLGIAPNDITSAAFMGG